MIIILISLSPCCTQPAWRLTPCSSSCLAWPTGLAYLFPRQFLPKGLQIIKGMDHTLVSVFLLNAQNLRLDLQNIPMFFYIYLSIYLSLSIYICSYEFSMMMEHHQVFHPCFHHVPAIPPSRPLPGWLPTAQTLQGSARGALENRGKPRENTTKNHGAIGKNDGISYENILNTSGWVGNLTI